ncbi:MAG: hypothetical protein IIX27_01840 [Ruminococcus sp.]|nr:hypothetical protein [Ruminococcus sp.]
MAYKNDKTKNRRRYRSRYRSAHNYKQQRSSSSKAAVLVAVLTFVVIASLVVVFTFGDSIYTMLDNALSEITATEAPTQAPTEKPTEKPTEPPTEAETDPPVQQDEQFMQLLTLNNMEESDIKGSQLVFVDGDESTLTCKVYCYEKNSDGVWVQAIGPFDGFIGEAGIDEMVSPYENKTPVGVFAIEYAFGTQYNPGTGLDYSQFTIYDYWITDPASINYNRWMTSSENKDWESAQWLYEYTRSYPHAIVFDYNRSNVDRSQGCAKFIHVSDSQTYGGVGIAESDIESLLYWLNASATPYVCISK